MKEMQHREKKINRGSEKMRNMMIVKDGEM